MSEELKQTLADYEMALADLSHTTKMVEESSKRLLEVLKKLNG